MNWISTLIPNRCVLCQHTLPDSSGICAYCLPTVKLFDVAQWPNLLLRPDIQHQTQLSDCDGLFSCAWYEGSIATWLSAFKFQNQTHYLAALHTVLSQQFNRWQLLDSGSGIDSMHTIPLHPIRYFFRGYNQTAQLWQPIISKANIRTTLHRAHYTKPQTSLGKQARALNTNAAFTVKGDLRGKTIAILDDVITTGATMNAAARACKAAGARTVWAMSVALTPISP